LFSLQDKITWQKPSHGGVIMTMWRGERVR